MSNRDLKHVSRGSSRSNPPAKRSSGGMMTGIIVGLIVGVGIAVGMTMYLNRASTPFSNLERLQGRQEASVPAAELLEPGSKLATMTPTPPVVAPVVVPPAPASAPVAAKPKPVPPAPADAQGERFDFYKILPGQQEAIPQDTKAADTAPAGAPRLFLQVGAFQSESDADNMKAKLALMGVEAKIQSLSLPDKGLMHRVRIGPFEHQEDVDALKARLRQDGVEASVVKLPPK